MLILILIWSNTLISLTLQIAKLMQINELFKFEIHPPPTLHNYLLSWPQFGFPVPGSPRGPTRKISYCLPHKIASHLKPAGNKTHLLLVAVSLLQLARQPPAATSSPLPICKVFIALFSCPEQLNRWPCHSLTHWLTEDFTTWQKKATLETCDLWDIWSE